MNGGPLFSKSYGYDLEGNRLWAQDHLPNRLNPADPSDLCESYAYDGLYRLRGMPRGPMDQNHVIDEEATVNSGTIAQVQEWLEMDLWGNWSQYDERIDMVCTHEDRTHDGVNQVLTPCAGPAILAPREIGHNALPCKLLCRVSATREARWPSTSIRPESTFLAVEGRTPHEVYFRWRPASRRPGIEPRKRWPRRWPCARPRTLIAGQPGDRFTLEVDLYGGARHLPIVSLKRAA